MMVKFKKRLLPIVGIAVGILTLRRLGKLGPRTAKAESSEEDHEHEDPKTATDHAAVAAEHARLAAEKAAPKRREN